MWTIIAVVAILVIYNSWSQKNAEKKKFEDNADNNGKSKEGEVNKVYIGTNLEPNQSEADKIYKEVEKKKSRAKDLGVDKLINSLYFDKIKYYPHWLKNGPTYVCSLITNPTETIEGLNEDKIKKTIFTLKGKEYIFTFKSHSFSTPDNEYHTHGDLELYMNDKKVLALDVAEESDQYSSNWRPFGISAFIEGEWVNDFKALEKQIEIDDKEREKKKREEPEKINKLKESFGIE